MGPNGLEGGAPPPGEIGASGNEGQIGPEQKAAPDVKTAMRDTMDRLEGKNQELGGQLFGVFGEGEHRFFTFPIPQETTIADKSGDNIEVSQFLAVTPDGFKLIQFNKGIKTRGDTPSYILARELIEQRMKDPHDETDPEGKPYSDAKSGYRLNEWAKGDLSLGIIRKMSWIVSFQEKDSLQDKSSRLTDISNSEEVAEIVRINREEAEKRSKVHEEERNTVNLQAAQKVNELLG